jgi:alpha-L-rhamnosidase
VTTLPAADFPDPGTRVTRVRTQYPPGLLGVPRHGLRLSWQVAAPGGAGEQAGYQIGYAGGGTGGTAGTVTDPVAGPASIGVPAPGPALPEGGERSYRVRIATAAGWSDWSEPCLVDAGVDALHAEVIGLATPPAGASPYLRRAFRLPGRPVRARLRVSALGLYEVFLNGRRVGDEHLAPGWTAYQERIAVATHDVTAQLVAGENVVGAVLADGWYRGRLGWRDRAGHYGVDLGLILRLDVEYGDGTTDRVVSDGSWRASTGSVTASSLYDGSAIELAREPAGWNAAGFDDRGWRAVTVLRFDTRRFEPRIAAPVRTIGEFPMTVVSTTGDRTVLDAGQNIAGWVRLTVAGRAGDTVTVRHAEVLEDDGQLHRRSLRSARATDTYLLDRDGEVTLAPRFTYHGFRYADLAGARLRSATALAVSSDLAPRGSFTSSHAGLNRLHENVRWSQRGNFVSLPTDCPQRDERLGWTGDAQAFAATANTLFDSESFWLSWLRDLEIDQAADGAVPAFVPNIEVDPGFQVDGRPASIMGRAGWADAATIVPWACYLAYGSTEVLARQLPSMRRWVAHLERRAGDDLVLPTEFQFGDWLDPDAPGDQPWNAKVPADFVANACYAHSARLLARTERIVGSPAGADRADALAGRVAAGTWRRWGAEAATTSTGCALAIEFGIAPGAAHAALGAALAALVRAGDGRIATGFLGTPLVLPALTRTGHLDEAFRMLLRRDPPSWLYQVDMGATTVWERWDAIRPDGSIHPGDLANEAGARMLSFNHDAYGAVIDWVYRTVGGIAPDPAQPGYRLVRIAPRPAVGIGHAAAAVDSRLGTVAIDWWLDGDSLAATVELPFGSTGRLDLPVTAGSVITVDGAAAGNGATVPAGRHRITVSAVPVAGGG